MNSKPYSASARAGPRTGLRLHAHDGIRRHARGLLLLLALATTAQDAQAQADSVATPPNPFGVFESFRLGNGLKVWYGQLPGATVTSMVVIAPVGSDHDPPGREQTAHLLEHVLFSDRSERREAELVRELTARGGSHNGTTYADRTTYWLNIGTPDAAYGVRWLYDVIAPRELTDALVERNREPVAIEVNARPRRLLDWAYAWYINHPWLRPSYFMAREFGLDLAIDRDVDRYTALRSISAAELNAFYNRHYAPTEMTLVIVSGAPRAAVQPALNETFGMMPWRPATPAPDSTRLRTGESRRVTWTVAHSTALAVYYRIQVMSGNDQLRLMLIAGLLERRLMEQLRRGDAKAVYSVGVQPATRGPANMLRILANLAPEQERLVRATIDREIARLMDAPNDTTFYRDRDALARELRNRYASPDALRGLAVDYFYRPNLHGAFPDLGSYLASAGADSIAAYASRVFALDNRALLLRRPLPASLGWFVLAAAIIIGLAARSYRALVLRPADMHAIRYVARLRRPGRFIWAVAAIAAWLVALRLVAAAAHFAAEHLFFTIDSFTLHFATAAALLFAATFGSFAVIGLTRYKVLVFQHELRIKSRTYRAAIYPVTDIENVSILEQGQELSGRVLGRLPGPTGRPVVVRFRQGTAQLLHVRRPEVLLAVLQDLTAEAASSPESATYAFTDTII